MNPHLQKLVSKGALLRRQMWKHSHEAGSRSEALLYSFLRVTSISWSGIRENRILSRAGALSFSSLLGLGPIIALVVLISGFVLDKTQPDMAQRAIEQVIAMIAPQVNLDAESGGQNEELSNLVNRFIEASQSGAVGIGGTIMLIFIVIQLFTTIEDAFNDIWGVKRGRAIITRVILYWTIISLGALLAFAGMAIIVSEAVQLSSFTDAIPSEGLGEWLASHGTRIASFVAMAGIIALFYRFIPNTQVEWRASLIGSAFTVACIALLHLFAFLYVERVAMQRTLYGSLGIVTVLMIGFYLFWLCLLIGGRVSFAVQNARFKSGQVAWRELSQASQESICLLLFTQVCRQFRSCAEPLSASELADRNGLPRQLASAALERLCRLGLASQLPPASKDPFDAMRYQPSKPLDKISLLDFKLTFESLGESPDDELFDSFDPLVRKYHVLINDARKASFEDLTLETALDQLDEKPA